MNLLRSVSLLALASSAAASQAALTVYTDRAQFLAALGTPTTTETFDTDRALVLGDNLYNGVNYRQTGADSFGFITAGSFNNNQDDDFPNGTEIVFGSAVRGFGADFDMANTNTGLAFTIDGEAARLSDFLPDPGTGFFGIVSDADFTTVVFGDATSNVGSEEYSFDNLTYGPSAAPSVPGPLAALPFALIAFNRRRKRA